MENTVHLSLVDSSTSRRATISFMLSGKDMHTEPFEDIGELRCHWPRSGVILIYDDGTALSEVLSQMDLAGSWLPVVAYCETPTTHQVVRAVRAGAVDYIAWPCDSQELLSVLDGAQEKAESIGGAKIREALARSRVERLSKREREVLSGVAGGLSNRIIGEQLSISPRTVEIHRANMLQKMGANHTSEAIRIAIEADLIG